MGRVKKALALHYLTCGMLTLVRSGGAKSMWQNMVHVAQSLCCFGYLPMDAGASQAPLLCCQVATVSHGLYLALLGARRTAEHCHASWST